MEFTGYALLNVFVGTILFGSSLAIYYLGRNSQSARIFSFLSLAISIWCITVTLAISTESHHFMLLVTRLNHFLGTIIATIFLIFALSYPHENKVNKKILISAGLLEIFFVYIFLFTNLIILKSSELPNISYFTWTPGSLWSIFEIYFIGCWSLGIILLLKKLKNEKDSQLKKSLRLVITAFIIGIIPPTIFTILLPQIGIYNYYWLSPSSALIWIFIVAYCITKHNLFNIRVIAIQLASFGLWTAMLVQTLLAKTTSEQITRSAFLVISIIFGITLIRNTLHVIEQHKYIEKLEHRLKQAYKSDELDQ